MPDPVPVEEARAPALEAVHEIEPAIPTQRQFDPEPAREVLRRRIMGLILTPTIALVGAATGFYFGGRASGG